MLSTIRSFVTKWSKTPTLQPLKHHLSRSLFQTLKWQQYTSNLAEVEIVDVNMDDLFPDDTHDDVAILSSNSVVTSVDIDPWVDEEASKEGTVDMELIETYKKDMEYAVPLENRSGSYHFKGIEIWLPKKMLNAATYRYSLGEDAGGVVPDDTRICRYEI